MAARFILGFTVFSVSFIAINTIGILMTIDEIVILVALFLLFLSYSQLCDAAIEKIENTISKMRRRRLE